MTITKKPDAKKYANENTVHTIKIVEALEGTNFEPVTIKRIMERSDLPYDKCRRVLLTLESLGWATENERKEWTLGRKIIRFAQIVSQHNF